jgi:hypothetical protein
VNAKRSEDNQDPELARLRQRFPRWRIWRGRTTGDYWAMPPRDHPAFRQLVSAGDIGELARRLARADGSRNQ